ncbi:sugar transferase [Thioclava sp. SK-1]|uniref:sugar transferase n=1 Tax=Thioclava sp. SK-1 TaxID=1889770 RepID=UPI0008269F42|nr:sugar transferase [Thioclava sp. SK-1]OCX66110.1 sugar transferase [Thioclava sp. SK-1]
MNELSTDAAHSTRPDLTSVSLGPRSIYRSYGKRWLDLALLILAAPIVIPLVGLLAVLIALDGSSPFFVQDRIGEKGHRFRMFKLRTMVPDAEQALAHVLQNDATLRQEWNRHQKLARDPRVTWIGAILRRASLDELPQLINVALGDMSLVGPRPMLVEQQALYPGKSYFRLRPGVTGNWQISDRHQSAFADRAQFDDVYSRTISLKMDLKILLATVGVVMRATGR